MSTWYRVSRSGNEPEPVEVVKSTTNRIWYMETWLSNKPRQTQASKHSWHSDFYETEDEAVQAIRKRHELAIERLQVELNNHRSRLGELKKKYGLQ